MIISSFRSPPPRHAVDGCLSLVVFGASPVLRGHYWLNLANDRVGSFRLQLDCAVLVPLYVQVLVPLVTVRKMIAIGKANIFYNSFNTESPSSVQVISIISLPVNLVLIHL